MKRTSIIFLTLLIYSVHYSTLTCAQDLAKNKIAVAIDKEYKDGIKSTKVVGLAVAVVDNNEVTYMNGFGFSDLANNTRVTPNTVFPIGSCTKAFTALAIMSLHEKGLLDINESVKKYIPELTIESRFEDDNEIYIKDILSHLSGLPSDILNGMTSDETQGTAWTINELNKQKTISPNRYVLAYSNPGYNLLGELIERVSGMSYAEYLRIAIFEPINMINTNVGANPLVSKGYDKKKEVSFNANELSSAGINSTVSDMTNFLKMMMGEGLLDGKRIFTKNTIAQMREDYIKGITLEGSDAYGFGMDVYNIRIEEEGDSSLTSGYGHNGYSPPFHADFRYIPERNVGVVVMSNTKQSGNMRSAGRVLETYLRVAKGINYKLMGKESYMLANCTANDIIGKYNLGVSIVEVNNIEKIKFRIDNVKIIMTRKENSFDYSIKAVLFGIIPIKVKDVVFRFVKKDGNMYITQLDLDRKTEQFVAAKVEQIPIPTSWRATIGKYDIVKTYSNEIEDFDFSQAKVEIKEQDGTVLLYIKTPGEKFHFALNIESDNRAYTGGVGRQMGYTVKILESGNIYFSGFEFSKIK